MDPITVIFCTLFVGVGGLFTLIGLFFLFSNVGFAGHSVRTTATVVGHVGDDQQKGWMATLLPPVVEFQDESGETRRYPVVERDTPRPYALGARITIRYNRDNPADIRIPSRLIWLFALMFTGIGTVTLVIGVVVGGLALSVQGP